MLSWLISPIIWIALFAGTLITLGYQRAPLKVTSIALGVFAFLYLILGDWWWVKILLIIVAAIVGSLNLPNFRRQYFSKPIFKIYKKILPRISDTEREALNAGSVWWDGELFSGKPSWNKLLDTPTPRLNEHEQAFLDGPVEKLCAMLNDWEITHELADLPEAVWDFMKQQKFFAMIIPKKYGGLEFSALAHSEVLCKVAGRSATAASIIAVPNSLGPAELLHHYGTEAQKNHYLPRLAIGEEIPCFALTSPRAGSDATSITDSGVVCK
ncbi:MAG: acyl-CoA dehydrogenase, partial [Gammaproteobacteria bacterium]|nr:acyl-CoA dehydrogenase [Gammaproteobacteria bacterium]